MSYIMLKIQNKKNLTFDWTFKKIFSRQKKNINKNTF